MATKGTQATIPTIRANEPLYAQRRNLGNLQNLRLVLRDPGDKVGRPEPDEVMQIVDITAVRRIGRHIHIKVAAGGLWPSPLSRSPRPTHRQYHLVFRWYAAPQRQAPWGRHYTRHAAES